MTRPETLDELLTLRSEVRALRRRIEDYDGMARYRWEQWAPGVDYPGGPLAAYDTMLAAAKDGIRALREDRERLDWLEQHRTPFEICTIRQAGDKGAFKYIEHSNGNYRGPTVRAAIDVARKGEK